MDHIRLSQHIEMMREWDPDSVLDALNISTEELLEVPEFLRRAIDWIEENNE